MSESKIDRDQCQQQADESERKFFLARYQAGTTVKTAGQFGEFISLRVNYGFSAP